jgi:hypothetical protein
VLLAEAQAGGARYGIAACPVTAAGDGDDRGFAAAMADRRHGREDREPEPGDLGHDRNREHRGPRDAEESHEFVPPSGFRAARDARI